MVAAAPARTGRNGGIEPVLEIGNAVDLHRGNGGLQKFGRLVWGWALTLKNWPVVLDGSECMTRRITPIKVLGLVALLALGAIVIFNHTSGMFKVCLFSPVKGKVVFKGQPVAGAVIERSYDWAWGNKKATDQTTTDQNGEFSLPAIHGTMILGQVAPHEPYIDQLIKIRHEGADYLAWATDKRNYEEFGELSMSKALGKGPGLQGKPIDLLCDLEKAVTNHGGVGGYGGIAELHE